MADISKEDLRKEIAGKPRFLPLSFRVRPRNPQNRPPLFFPRVFCICLQPGCRSKSSILLLANARSPSGDKQWPYDACVDAEKPAAQKTRNISEGTPRSANSL